MDNFRGDLSNISAKTANTDATPVTPNLASLRISNALDSEAILETRKSVILFFKSIEILVGHLHRININFIRNLTKKWGDPTDVSAETKTLQ